MKEAIKAVTIRSLQCFLAVAQELSMSLAAQRLQLSQGMELAAAGQSFTCAAAFYLLIGFE